MKGPILKILFSILVACCLSLVASSTMAAILSLEPSVGEYRPGDTFIEEIQIDTEGECVNAVKIDLTFPEDLLEAVDFSKGDSILTLSVEEPKINQANGAISFSGGVPGGYCGKIPGDPGASNLLGKIVFKTKETGSPTIGFLESSQVLLNDGKGTEAELTTRGAAVKITRVSPVPIPRDEWQEELEKDKNPPEPFVLEVRQDSRIFEGRYYIIFSTSDKQTGLDYFQVKEEKGDWKMAESPYLLEDQELQSIIKVKAIDKAGNERIVEAGPIESFIPPEKKPFPWWIIIPTLIGIGIIWWIIRKLKIKNQRLKT